MILNFHFKKTSLDLQDSQDKIDHDNDFLNAINLFISQRKKFGISLEELSKKTKISRNVLIAIENGWKKYLPEKTYLIAMIKKIEIELHLEIGSLKGLLTPKVTPKDQSKFKFKFINIDFLDSWFGSFLYLAIMFLSILAINSQQKYLLKINSVSTEPVFINDLSIKNENKVNSPKK
tara:strand:- start:1494 stop:2024 length:531 start_codon:yes stop_codon:yes gene_type:complete